MLMGGTHKADVAVFYNAEGEWSGKRNQLFSEICKILTRGLVDYDIVPYDALENAKVKNNRLYINGEDYGALIISESEVLPMSRLECFARLSEGGLPVIFTEALPTMSAEGEDISLILPCFEMTKTKTLVSKLRELELCHVNGKGEGVEELCFYHVARDGKDIYLFSNEGINDTLDAEIFLKHQGECLIYEPWDNKCYRDNVENGILSLQLEGGNMLFVIFDSDIPAGTPDFTCETERTPLPLLFDISVLEEGKDEYEQIAEKSALFDISAPDKYPNFSGSVRYLATTELPKDYTVLDLGQVGEVAQVWLNGKYLGARINAPYKFSMASAMVPGENKLEIVVKSNLGHRRREGLSGFMQIPPTGILGDISLCRYTK